jgi:hypothetical protein
MMVYTLHWRGVSSWLKPGLKRLDEEYGKTAKCKSELKL